MIDTESFSDLSVIMLYLGIFLLSAVKLLFAPGAAIASGIPATHAFIVTSLGACAGIAFFYYAGHWFGNKVRTWYARYFGPKHPVEPLEEAPRKVFSKQKRLAIKIKYNFGMIGLALLTPGVVSIPIGSVIAARFYYHNRWMLPLLWVSAVIWCLVLTYVSAGIKRNLVQ